MLAKLQEALTSKKLWATVGACITAASLGDWYTVFQLVMVYVGALGLVDAAHHLSLPSPKQVEVAQAWKEAPSNEALLK